MASVIFDELYPLLCRQRESDSRAAVEDAHAKFYSAFRKRDMEVRGLLHLQLSSSFYGGHESQEH